jgi:hypothetical protein
MFEVEHLLMALIAALVDCDAASLVPHFDLTRIKSYFNRLAGRSRRRIEISPHSHAAQSVNAGKQNIRQLKSLLGKRE